MSSCQCSRVVWMQRSDPVPPPSSATAILPSFILLLLSVAPTGRIPSCAKRLFRGLFCSWRRKSNKQSYLFWWQDPWIAFPERWYLLLLLFCLVTLQNQLLATAWFNPSLYGLPEFRFIADSLSPISVHGILFLWLCLCIIDLPISPCHQRITFIDTVLVLQT
jgi:hypothetical protein